MRTSPVHDDLALAFILGRNDDGFSFSGSVALSFVGCLGVAAATATGLVTGDRAFACFVLVATVTAWWSSPAAAATGAMVAFMFANGFAFDTVGTLAWHGETDVVRLVAIVALAITVSVLGSGHRARLRAKAELSAAGTSIPS